MSLPADTDFFSFSFFPLQTSRRSRDRYALKLIDKKRCQVNLFFIYYFYYYCVTNGWDVLLILGQGSGIGE